VQLLHQFIGGWFLTFKVTTHPKDWNTNGMLLVDDLDFFMSQLLNVELSNFQLQFKEKSTGSV